MISISDNGTAHLVHLVILNSSTFEIVRERKSIKISDFLGLGNKWKKQKLDNLQQSGKFCPLFLLAFLLALNFAAKASPIVPVFRLDDGNNATVALHGVANRFQ